jgi:hypothetical protein
MSNALYTKAKEALLEGLLDLTDDTLKICLVKSTYTVNLSDHQYLSDIGTSNIAATSSALLGKSTSDGIFDAENITIEDYGTSGFSYMILFKDTGVTSTSRLIAYIDTADGLPVSPSESTISITVNWSNAINKIFTL